MNEEAQKHPRCLTVEAAKILETAGIDLMDISGGMCRYTLDGHEEPGYFGAEAKAVREAVQLPVLLTGGIQTLADAQDLLDKGYADLIGVGRALLQNPDWAEEAYLAESVRDSETASMRSAFREG